MLGVTKEKVINLGRRSRHRNCWVRGGTVPARYGGLCEFVLLYMFVTVMFSKSINIHLLNLIPGLYAND